MLRIMMVMVVVMVMDGDGGHDQGGDSGQWSWS